MFSSAYITVPTKQEALAIGEVLVRERLAACANVFDGVCSLYWWDGEVQTHPEAALIVKTRTNLIDDLTMRVKELHSSDVPCVVAWLIKGGNPEYLEWLHAETEAAEK